ncbi:MAG: hypothetical protein DYG98_08635 [Haliscomenobacteraceae bacterium CHB4]|nr:hypothetical protein [Haliscomenobacteraceae bacterium CHB4]
MNKKTLIEKIEAWLDDYLPDGEAAALQEKVETDPDFRALVELVQARRSVVEAYQADYYLKKIKAWEETPTPVFAPQARNLWKIALIAATVLVVAGMVYWICRPHDQPPSEDKKDAVVETLPPMAVDTAGKKEPDRAKSPKKLLLKFSTINDSIRIDTMYVQPSDTLKVVRRVYADMAIPIENELKKALSITRTRGGEMQSSSYTQGLQWAKTDPDSAILLLVSVPETNNFYYDAQQMLAFLYVHKNLYHEAAVCYKRYRDHMNTYKEDWLLVGFYLKDYKNSRKELMALLDEIIQTKGGHKYINEAKLLKRWLKE